MVHRVRVSFQVKVSCKGNLKGYFQVSMNSNNCLYDWLLVGCMLFNVRLKILSLLEISLNAGEDLQILGYVFLHL